MADLWAVLHLGAVKTHKSNEIKYSNHVEEGDSPHKL